MTVARPLPHDAARLHVTGRARYVDDIPAPANTLHLAFGLSAVAHGAVTGIDLSAVRAAPGVVGRISECNGGWCRLDVKGQAGFVPVGAIWGVEPGETLP